MTTDQAFPHSPSGCASGAPPAVGAEGKTRRAGPSDHCAGGCSVRVRTAHRHVHGDPPGDEQWLVYEWPKEKDEPTKLYLSNLDPITPLKRLVLLAKLRWRIERDYQELKQEIGLDHFEGRSWKGFHHHAALCAVAHGFLALRRALFPPEASSMDAA